MRPFLCPVCGRPFPPEAVAQLDPKEGDIVVRRFALAGHGALSRPQIGRALGVRAERVRQIERRALRRLHRIICLGEEQTPATG